MGVDVTAWDRPRPDDERFDRKAYGFKSQRGGVKIKTCPNSFNTRESWPEIHLVLDYPERRAGDEDVKAPLTPRLSVRIHGVTIPELVKEMVKDEKIFNYLASAVDYLRANPGQYE